MASYKDQMRVRQSPDSYLDSRQLLVRDLVNLILLEKYQKDHTLQNWMKRDHIHQQLFKKKNK
jgi:hypothetical protein